MKTKEELVAIKEEYEELKEMMKDLTDEELGFITGGVGHRHRIPFAAENEGEDTTHGPIKR